MAKRNKPATAGATDARMTLSQALQVIAVALANVAESRRPELVKVFELLANYPDEPDYLAMLGNRLSSAAPAAALGKRRSNGEWTCRIYTMPPRSPAPIHKAAEHPHHVASGRGGDRSPGKAASGMGSARRSGRPGRPAGNGDGVARDLTEAAELADAALDRLGATAKVAVKAAQS